MTAHAALILALTAATEIAIVAAAVGMLRAHRKHRAAVQAEEQAAALRAQAVDDAIAADDNCRLLVALGLIDDPQLADLPRRDAAELQMLIYPADITTGGAR